MPSNKKPTEREQELLRQNEELETRLAEAEETLRAIREGEVDAVIVSGSRGEQVFSLVGSDSIYRLIVETMKEAAFTVTFDGTILFCNAQFGEFVKRPMEQIIGHSFQGFAAPHCRAEAVALLATAQQRPIKQRLVFQATDGTAVPAHVSANVLNQPDGLSICVVASDLSELENSTELIGQLRRQQEALARSEERFRALTETSSLAVGVSSSDGKFLYINQAYEKLFGCTVEELSHMGASELWGNPEDRRKMIDAVKSKGFLMDYEVELKRKDGTPFHAQLSVNSINFGGNQAIMASVLDITERKRAEEALRKRQEELQAVLDLAPVAIWMAHDAQCLQITGNHYAEEFIMRVPRSSNISASAQPGDAAVTYKALRNGVELKPEELPAQAAAATGQLVAPETLELVFPNGRVTYVMMGAAPLFDAEGRVRGSVAAGVDVTMLKQTGDALRASEARLRLALDAARAGSWEWDVLTNRAVWSEELWKLYGLEPHSCEPSYEAWLQTVHPDDRARIAQGVQESARVGAELMVEWRVRGRDGAEHWLMSRGQPMRDAGGRVVRYIGVAVDVTEHKWIETELQDARDRLEQKVAERTAELASRTEAFIQAQKMEAIGRLAGGVAHDFNNLLTVVTGFGRRVLRDEALDPSHRAAVDQMTRAGERAATLTRQLLAFSRKQVLQPESLDLNAAMRELCRILPASLGEDIELVCELREDCRPVFADRNQIEQTVMNLANNARDAMPDGGRLTLRTSNVTVGGPEGGNPPDVPAGDYVCLEVEDTGTGMSEEVRQHIFEPFFTTKDRGAGTGLGLASVYGMVEQSGGHIRVKTAPGQGTTFSLYFPKAAVEDQPRATADANGRLPRGRETILLVEDERSVCDLVASDLRDMGYTVLPCSTIGDALKAAEMHPGTIDLMLADVIMPGVSGPTLAQQLMARSKVPRVLYMSGHAEKHIAQHGVLRDGVELIGKPFTAEALARKIRGLLDGRTARH